MRDVARRAGVKPATLYDYFPTKELLVRALEDQAWARATDRARATVESRPNAPIAESIAGIVESFMREMIPAARTYGLRPESPFGREDRDRRIGQFVALAARALGHGACQLRAEGDLRLALSIATHAVGMLTFVAARDHVAELEDGSYPREVGRMVAHYLVRDSR